MSDDFNFNLQDPNADDSIPPGLEDALSGLSSDEAAEPVKEGASGPLESLLRTIQAESHAQVKSDARMDSTEPFLGFEGLEKLEKEMEAETTEYSLTDIAKATESWKPAASQADSQAPLSDAAARALKNNPAEDRRRRRRALISAPVRVRGLNVTHGGPDEISTTVDVSRIGLLFITSLDCYTVGMDVMVTFPYSNSPQAIQAEQSGRVMRVHKTPEEKYAIAIALGIGIGEDLVDSSGRKLTMDDAHVSRTAGIKPDPKKSLILLVDSDVTLRDALTSYLQSEGYEVIGVNSSDEAREVLRMFTPALVIAEVEGEGLPGFDICAHVKSTPRLRAVPVVLTTRSAYPSDYSNAHSLGAVVCMARPFKQERLGHIVRLLAPPPAHLQAKFTPRPGDPTRRPGCDNRRKKPNGNGNGKRFKFPSFR